MTITPFASHIFVQRVDPAEERGLIAIPDSVNQVEQHAGKIVAVAAFYRSHKGTEVPMRCKVGQYAVFRPRSADVFSIKGQTFYNVKEDDILLLADTLKDFQQITAIDP